MAATKTLKTRIKLKYDSLTNWLTNNPVLLAGEVAVATIETSNSASGLTPPAVGIKVGDGTSKFAALNWIQAIAGDVPSWAKEEDWATVKAAYNKAIADAIKTVNDGLAESSKEVGATELITKIVTENGAIKTIETTPILASMVYTDATKAKTVAAAITDINTNVSKKADSSVVTTQISNAKTALLGTDGVEGTHTIKGAYDAASSAQTAAEGKITTELGKLTLNDAAATDNFVTAVKQTNGKIEVSRAAVTTALGIDGTYNKSTNKLATVSTVTSAIGNLDVTDTAVADKLITAVSETNGKIAVTREAVSDVLGIDGTYNKSSNKLATVSTVNSAKQAVLEELGEIGGAMRFRGTVEADPTTTAPTAPADGMGAFRAGDVLVNSTNTKEFLYTGDAWEELGTEGIYALDSELTTLEGTVSGHTSTLSTHTSQISALNTFKDTTVPNTYATKTTTNSLSERIDALDEAVGEGGSVSTQITNALGALDVTTSTGEGKFVSGVTQTNGKIAVTKAKIVMADVSDATLTGSTGTSSAAATALAQKGYVDAKISATASDATTAVTNAINGLDSSVAATAASGNVYSVLTGVTQTNGKLAAKTEVTLAAIAKTGNVNDLVQGSSDYIVFDCGTSSTVI